MGYEPAAELTDWMTEWLNEWMNEWMNERMNELEINMHHLPKAMQYRQVPSAILTKFCVVDGFLSLPFS